MTHRYEATPEAYRRVFEESREGAAVLEDLITRFARPPKGQGIDRILNLAQLEGRRDILDFINARINQANGVNDDIAEDDGRIDG